jgi:hypothetical protein
MLAIQDLGFSGLFRPAHVRGRGRRACLLLLSSLLTFFGGCASVGSQLSGLQFDSITTGNNQHAQDAALAAQQQTCSAAQGYRDASQKAAADSAALAAQSAGLASGIKTAIDQRGAVMTYLADSSRRIDAALAAYQSAKAQFEGDFVGDVVNGVLNLRNVVADTGAYSEAILGVGRAYETAAMDLELLVGTSGTQLAQYLPPGVDVVTLAADFRAQSRILLDGAIANSLAKYDLPANYASIRVDQLSNTAFLDPTKSDFYVYQTFMQSQRSYGNAIGDSSNPIAGSWAAVRTALSAATGTGGAGGTINAAIASSNNQLALITDRTQLLSAEAARNAWLAVEACGGTPPSGLPPLASPFDNRPELIPSWSSTFWDFSSP